MHLSTKTIAKRLALSLLRLALAIAWFVAVCWGVYTAVKAAGFALDVDHPITAIPYVVTGILALSVFDQFRRDASEPAEPEQTPDGMLR